MALGMALTTPFMQPGTIVVASPSKRKRVVALPAICATSEVAPFRPLHETSRSKPAAKLPTKQALHFGAGNIGRGFVAEFLYQSGFEVIFCDRNQPIVDKLNNTHSYTVTEISAEGAHDAEVSNYRAINSTTTVTSLLCAPSRSALKMVESALVRYRVCLIEITAGSLAPASMNSSTVL